MLVSIVIPCRSERENIEPLLKGIEQQQLPCAHEIMKVIGETPLGHAKNVGAERARGDVLIIMDNDIEFGHEHVLNNLIEPLLENEKIGVSGVSVLLPKHAGWFQHQVVDAFPRMEHAMVEKMTDVAVAAGACCAMRKDVFFEVGRIHDTIIRGTDGEFCRRVLQKGYRVVIPAKTWVYHSTAKNVIELSHLAYRNGRATSFVDKNFPELNLEIGHEPVVKRAEKMPVAQRKRRYIKNVIKAFFTFRVIELIYRLIYAFGYFSERLFPSKTKHVS